MLYPLFFRPIYKSTLWGGRNLERLYKRPLPEGKVAESWEVCCHKNDCSVILNGKFEGKNLEFLMKNYKSELIGSKKQLTNGFPILIKIIDACDRLSVQVHPDDKYAKKYENDSGKTEMWYIAEAKDDAKLIYGLKPGINKSTFSEAVRNNKLENCLNYINVAEGDVLFIPSGTVHAILEGIVLIEIQQNSDLTYRLYDWDRVDSFGNKRPLHIVKALDVINYDFKGKLDKHSKENFNGYTVENLVLSKFFNTDKIEVSSTYKDSTDGSSFFAFTILMGSGKLVYKNEAYSLTPGTSFLIPASCGEFWIEGNISLLKTYI